MVGKRLGKELIFTFTPKKEKKFAKEKDTYPYLKKVFFLEAYRCLVLYPRGYPDFKAYSTRFPEVCGYGYYEVKFDGNKLSPAQEVFFYKEIPFTPCYLIHVFPNGRFEVYKLFR